MIPRFAALEAGGTKFFCAVGTGPEDLRAVARFPTTTPAETLARVIAFFDEQRATQGPFAALGIGSFGPVDLDPNSATWGFITSTPKEGWAQTDLAPALGAALGVPVAFDTDVNAAALGEGRWGAARGRRSLTRAQPIRRQRRRLAEESRPRQCSAPSVVPSTGPSMEGKVLVPQKVQLDEDDVAFIEAALVLLNYKTKSDYLRAAIQEKIRTDRRRLRELRRQQAMEAYGGDFEAPFEPIEGEDFEDR